MLLRCLKYLHLLGDSEKKGIKMIKIKYIISVILLASIISCVSTKENRISKIKSLYPQWDPTTVENVADRKITVGMSEEMVLTALGKPWDISHKGPFTIWGYGYLKSCGGGYGSCEELTYFIHFRDKKVTEITGDNSKLGFRYR